MKAKELINFIEGKDNPGVPDGTGSYRGKDGRGKGPGKGKNKEKGCKDNEQSNKG